ncbi:glycosyltransferase family 4 protein [Turicibacter sanguinis]|uniref:glycosyltransferase family 4 protein n=1 Tax=Turicibacter sanguinis TaxID=154288 RepID=UPI00232C6BC4|nr:glycosyltransferase family 4 protein [Turicibacter sanguinis]MDB8542311.1 glycosyltransferase family 4 protein [Turicibacter sanguinis]
MADSEQDRSWNYDDYANYYSQLLPGGSINIKYRNRLLMIHYNYSFIKQIRKYNPDLVVLSGAWILPTIIITALYCKIFKKSTKMLFWSESHLLEQRSYSNIVVKFRDKFRKKFYGLFDGFWTPGEMANEFVKLNSGNNHVPIFFIPNLVDNAFFEVANNRSELEKIEIKNNLGIDEDCFVFICPARLVKDKGLIEFLNNSKNVITNKKHLIIIAGEGPLKDDIIFTAEQCKINYRMVGQQTPKDMVNLYSIGDVFLLPSLSDPNPLSVIEACWAGLPLFISRYVGNHPELLTNNNGILFDTLDINDVEKKILELYDKDEEWFASAKKGSYKNVKEKYLANVAVHNLVRDLNEFVK